MKRTALCLMFWAALCLVLWLSFLQGAAGQHTITMPGAPSCCPPGANWCPAPSPLSVRAHKEFEFIGRVLCTDATGPSVGTGTIIERDKTYSYILTSQHVVRGARRIYFQPPGHARAECRVMASEEASDWALLRCQVFPIRPALAAIRQNVNVQRGANVSVFGYANGNRFSVSSGRIKGFVSGDRGRTWDMLDTTCTSVVGMSGGPFVCNGHVIGVLTGSRPGMCVGACLSRLRAAISAALPRRRPAATAPPAPPVVDIPPPPPVREPDPPAESESLAKVLTAITTRLEALTTDVMDLKGRIVPAQENLALLTARIAALEAANEGPLFYHQAAIQIVDSSGNVVERIELQPRTPVLRGGTLEYLGTPREGAITDSFRVTESP